MSDEHAADVLKASINVLAALVDQMEEQVAQYELAFEPVAWICCHPHCGGPNQTPRLLFPAKTNTLAISLRCVHCGCVQDHNVLQSFL